MRRTVLAGLATICLAATLVGTAGPADAKAGPPPTAPFNDLFHSESFQAQGDYLPISGIGGCVPHGNIWVLWYAAGPTPDYFWDIDHFAPLTYTSSPKPVNGTYQPVVGDFDDDNCDDILWYAPGTANDVIWWGEGNGNFTPAPLTVNGTYEPLVLPGLFPEGDRVFWYSPGSGQEYLWTGQTDRTFDHDIGPTVNGTFRTSVNRGGGGSILFHQPGPGADYIWDGVIAGETTPLENAKVTINGDYLPLASPRGIWLLDAPGNARDHLILDWTAAGSLTTVTGTISGTFETGVRSPHSDYLVIWHAPGSAQDFLWLPLM